MSLYDHCLTVAALLRVCHSAQTVLRHGNPELTSMTTYTHTMPNGETHVYKDKKRWLWSASVAFALWPLIGVGLHAWTGESLWLLAPIAYAYLLVPILDWLVGEDQNNPPEAIVPQLEADPYYRILTYIIVPLHFVSLAGCAWWAGTQPLEPWAFFALAATAGLGSGLAINTGHEMGHKAGRFERLLARFALAVPAYGHFCVEHNRGHHTHVATPEDPASSRMGESIYRFALREIPGAWKRGWQAERKRLKQRGRPFWSLHNEILQSNLITLVFHGSLVLAFGLPMVVFLLIHNVFAWWQLTSANYIEHYGLLRMKNAAGRYETCKPHHSWNSNHIYSNLALFHLERHSDHHAHPMRRYQSLRHFDDLPQLPNGYFGMYLLAYIPALWYRVMDPRVLSLKQVEGDLSKVNLDPNRADQLKARYQLNPAA